MTTPTERVLDALRQHGGEPRQVGASWIARCPAHDDKKPSLTIGEGRNGGAVLQCHGTCKTEAVVAALGLRMADLMPPREPQRNGKPRIVATYDYRDEAGKLIFQAVRFEPKDFRQRRPKPGGGWEWSVKGVPKLPYRLPELLAEPTRPVFVVEGEKDCENLAHIGVVASCNSGGAGKWTSEHAEYLRGRRVVVLPDNDDPGRKHGQQVAQSLHGIAQWVRVVDLPDLPEHGDVSDWIVAGGTKDALRLLVKAAPKWTPTHKPAGGPRIDAPGEPEPAPYVPFPVELLPSPVREFVEQGAIALGCDPGYVALPLLVALASAVGNSRRARLKSTWAEPCVLWGALIGESGTLKSPALDLAVEPVCKRQAVAFHDYELRQREHAQHQQLYEADLTAWKKDGRKKSEPPPTPPEAPVWSQLVAQDTTVEALAVLLENQPRGLLVERDELSGWLNSFDSYKSCRGADVAHWLSMHRAGSVLFNRKTGRSLIRVRRAAVSVIGGVQPRTLEAALGGRFSADGPDAMEKPQREHFDNGLAARLLLLHPPRRPKVWTDAELDSSVRGAVEVIFGELFGLALATDANGEPVPKDIPLTADAKRRFVAFYNTLGKEQLRLKDDLAAAWSKIEGYAPRFALLFALIQDPNAIEIDGASMKAGIALSRWFGEEAARVYAEIGGSDDSPEAREDRQQQRLVEWIRERGGCTTLRDLIRGPREYRDSAKAENALRKLVEAGLGQWIDAPPAEQGGRPTRIFHLATTGDGDKTPQSRGETEVSSPVGGNGDTLDRVRVTI